MSMLQYEPMSKVDTAWLRMEQPTNLMMITGVMLLDDSLDFERLLETIDNRFLAFRRFRQKAVMTPGGAFWETDADFDLHAHLRRTALPGAADRAELQELVSELASTPLDPAKPRWQFHLVENYRSGPVLILRIHHCYADGMALVQVLLSLTDPSPQPRPSARSRDRWTERRVGESGVFRRLLAPARQGLDSAGHWATTLRQGLGELWQNPARVEDYAREVVDVGEELRTTLMLGDDPDSPLKGRLSSRKRVAWAPALPLVEVKAVAKALGCTVNDVLISVATGALNYYLRSCGDDRRDLEIRATVPVNLRPLEHARELGNHFGLVYLPLPVGEPNPLRRLVRVHAEMTELKRSRQAQVAFGLLAAVGLMPSLIQKQVLSAMSRKATTVLTNVPGPRQQLYLAGSPLREMMFWVPQNGDIGIGISILSYAGKVQFGLMGDRRLIADPADVVAHFSAEFEKLLYLVLQMPDGEVTPAQARDWLEHELENIHTD